MNLAWCRRQSHLTPESSNLAGKKEGNTMTVAAFKWKSKSISRLSTFQTTWVKCFWKFRYFRITHGRASCFTKSTGRVLGFPPALGTHICAEAWRRRWFIAQAFILMTPVVFLLGHRRRLLCSLTKALNSTMLSHFSASPIKLAPDMEQRSEPPRYLDLDPTRRLQPKPSEWIKRCNLTCKLNENENVPLTIH